MTGQAKPRKVSTKAQQNTENKGFSTNFEAMSKMVEALRDAGRIENVDSARAKIALHLAQMVDEYPENVGLWQQYRAAEAALREVGDNGSDGIADLFAALDSEVRNAENRVPAKRRR